MLSKSKIFPIVLCVISGLFLANSLVGQESPYEVSWKKDGFIIGGILAAEVGGLVISSNVKPLTETQINQLNPADINSFDRDAIFNNSANARKISDVLLFGSNAFPFILMSSKRIRGDYKKIIVLGAESLFLTSVLTTYTKSLVQRTRPFAYNPDVAFEKKIEKTARLSFFSGHTSAVSGSAFFGAKVFADYFPDSKWKPFVWTAAALIPATTGYMRVKGGKHFPTDVMTGYAVGALAGILIPHFHKKNRKKKDKKVSLSAFPQGNQVGLVLTW